MTAGASKAPTITRISLERQIVILIFERPRKVLEVLAAATCRTLGAARRGLPASVTAAVTTIQLRTTLPRAQHDQLAHVDLGDVAGLVLLVLILAILDASFDVQLVALLHVLLDDVGQLLPHLR